MPEEPFNPYEMKKLERLALAARLMEEEANKKRRVLGALFHDHKATFDAGLTGVIAVNKKIKFAAMMPDMDAEVARAQDR